MARNERDASPERFSPVRPSHEIERIPTASSTRPIHQRALELRETLLCVECLHNETWKDTQQFLVGYKQRNRSMQAQLDGASLARVEIAGSLFQKWGLESHIHPFYQHRKTMWLSLLALTILSMRRIGQ